MHASENVDACHSRKSCFRNKSLCSWARFGLEQIRDRTDKGSGTYVLSALFRFRARCAVSLSPCSLRATARLNKFAGKFITNAKIFNRTFCGHVHLLRTKNKTMIRKFRPLSLTFALQCRCVDQLNYVVLRTIEHGCSACSSSKR